LGNCLKEEEMRSYPCVVIGLASEAAQRLREGDGLTLKRVPPTIACYRGADLIGHIPWTRGWVARLLDDGDSHEVTVTGFDTDQGGKLAGLEITITISGDDRAERPAIRSIISEIGDELRILAMVGAVDGRLAPAERGVMEQFAAMRAAELELAPDDGEIAHAVRWARRHAPNILDVAGIVTRLTDERPKVLGAILEACELVAEADGQIAPEERQSMITLSALLEQGMSAAKR
jgi:tellurite resistance protein